MCARTGARQGQAGLIVLPTASDTAEAELRHADYIAALRPLLPAAAFRPHLRAFIPIAIHCAIIVGLWIVCRCVTRTWWPLIALGIGTSMASLAFLAHDVAHRSVTKNRFLLYPTELVLWGFTLFPPTLWRRVHAAHHAHTNGTDDPDRRFLEPELSLVGTVAAATLFPNRLRFNITFWLQWLVYGARHGVAALFYRGSSKPDYVPARPFFTTAEKLWIVFEIVFIAAWQIALWRYLGSINKLMVVTLIPAGITSAVVSWYFYTNHSLNPIDDSKDVLAATTSVIVPAVCNKLHSNFSYHTEHHLFPNMNPTYYPLVSKLLARNFPARYQHMPMAQAWSKLLQNPIATSRRGAAPSPRATSAARRQRCRSDPPLGKARRYSGPAADRMRSRSQALSGQVIRQIIRADGRDAKRTRTRL
jgi:fatty acid desaturase